jgi:NAD(P)-dependent dehydrogenase (short-subunit alcohol dehydrogenase family)
MPVPLMCACGNISRERILASSSGGLFDVAGKTALVTGGGSGLGRFMATALAEAGARICLVGRREAELRETLGGHEGAIFAMDLAVPDASQRLFDALTARHPQPDIIVNAAGVNPRIPADDISEDDWRYTVHLNLNMPFLVSQKFVPHMKRAGWGRIINIASLQSSRAFENGIAYGAAKGGIMQLTRAMAEAWSRHGIMVNALAPGFFPTELTAPLFADDAIAGRLAAATAIGRNGALEDMRGPLLFLASDASGYVTGQSIAVDGGFTAK